MTNETEHTSVTSDDQLAAHETASADDKPVYRRGIKSFVIRAGRLTKGQELALERKWSEWGVELSDGEINPAKLFGRDAHTVLEIGFGMGQSLVEMAQNAPEKNYFGVEVHLPGVGSVLNLAEEAGIDNLRVSKDDAIEVLKLIPDNSIDTVQLFFPDPWHKKKHHKRRIVQSEFAQTLRRIIKPGGIFHLATDWEPYMEHMLEIMDVEEGFENIAGSGNCIDRPDDRPLTKFEKRGQGKGHGVWDMKYRTLG
ncbi:MAG: tRNA (guanosine(46)-N7)-methyltransferase TrmB [Oceanospirillaceae bacterium]|nr:tRNA (guanosine(46)-N7)-methyltransferase TrmB [Oceanospirillaceae bacterium]